MAKSFLTLCNSMHCGPTGSSVHGISRQEYCSGLPFPLLGDLPDPGIEPESPALAGRLFTTEPGVASPEKPQRNRHSNLNLSNGSSGGSVVKNLLAKAGDTGDMGSVPGPGRAHGGNGNSLRYSCLEKPMDRRDRWAQPTASQRVRHD